MARSMLSTEACAAPNTGALGPTSRNFSDLRRTSDSEYSAVENNVSVIEMLRTPLQKPASTTETRSTSSWTVWLRKPFWQSTFDDVKNVSWGWLLRRFVSFILPTIIIGCWIYLMALMSRPPYLIPRYHHVCKPNGDFSIYFGEYNPWQKKDLFAINISFGTFSFGVAKFIDVCWDVVCPDFAFVLIKQLIYRRLWGEEAKSCSLCLVTKSLPRLSVALWRLRKCHSICSRGSH